ncbi:ATP-binding cassette domain-containing protein [Xylophilus sp. Kf1]|nr:ATP-binding cassette domain-containing protein [Xylophilus sp. Kf1]
MRISASLRAWLPSAAVGLLLAAGIVLALGVNSYYVFVLTSVALLALAGVGLNILLGLTGQMSFGHGGFYAIGAYAVGILTVSSGLSFWLAWPVAVLLSAGVGALVALPALRVSGPYLAMITIAFAFIVEHGVIEAAGITGGQNGLMGIAAPSLGPVQGERAVAVLAMLSVGVALAAYALLSRGTWGAAMRAVRDSETACESLGLSPLVVKTVAFACSAACAGAAGALFAPLSGFIAPNSFGFMQSILFVLVVLIGGRGTVVGPLAGAIVVGLLPELLASLEEYRLLFFGALLLVVLWVAPRGLVGLVATLARRLGLAMPVDSEPVPALPAGAPLPLAARGRSALRAEGLTMQFGGVRAVDALGFTAEQGRVTSLIGPNGAGKSTALNMLSGFYRATRGSFALGAQPLTGRSALHIARSGLARTYQTSLLFDSLSVADNVALAISRGRLGGLLGAARLRSPETRRRACELLAWCGYGGPADKPAGDLAHVDRRLVEIARALALDPDFVLLDEPAAGLSREDKSRLATLLRRIADTGLGVLIVEHDMALVMGISDRIVVLDAGRHLATGTPAEVRANREVQQAYLGESVDAAPAGAQAAPRTPGGELLGVNALVAGYGAEPVLHGIDLRVRRGEVVALLGANGAGKSTLMRALSGLHRPLHAGGIHLDGVELGESGPEAIVALGMVLVPEGRQVFPELTVLDNIRLGAFLKQEGREARVEAMLQRFPRLRERLHQRAGLLSGGEQQMLAIARALMAQPRILLLDEPSLGLAPKVIADLFAALDQLRREGMTILLVDQMAGLALALADRAYVMENGRVVAEGSSAEIAADGALAAAYLGESPAAPAAPDHREATHV